MRSRDVPVHYAEPARRVGTALLGRRQRVRALLWTRGAALWLAGSRWLRANSFAPQRVPQQWRRPALAYLLAQALMLGALGTALLLMRALPGFVASGALIIVVVLLVSLTWGAAPGLSVTFTGALLFGYLILPLHASLAVMGVKLTEDLLVALAGAAIVIIASLRERMRRTSEQALHEAVQANQRAVGLLASLAQARAESEVERQRLQVVLDVLPAGVAIVDTQGRFLQLNAAMRAVWGEGAPMFSNVVEDGRSRAWGPIWSVLQGKTLTGADAVDTVIRRLDGREGQFSVSGAPLYNSAQQGVGGVLVMHDVTERRSLERRTQEKLSALLVLAEALVWVPEEAPALEAADDLHERPMLRRFAELIRSLLGCQRAGVVVMDQETSRLQLVAATGLSPEELRYWQLVVERTQLGSAPAALDLAELRAGKVVIIDQQKLARRDYLYQPSATLVAPMRVGERLVGLLALSRATPEASYSDEEMALAGAVAKLAALVIERERLLREREEARTHALALREANRQMDTFLGIASHELRTPLATIKLSLQLIQHRLEDLASRDSDLRGTITSFLGIFDRSIRQEMRLERLVRELLDVSRIKAGKLELQLEPADLGALVRSILEEHRALEPERTFVFEAPENLVVPVRVDADRIGQVLTNYLANALKYSEEASPVTVGLTVEDRQVRVWVRDQGPGIFSEELERVWERFHRVRGIAARSGAGVGLGLGLYICRTIIERHHGQVGVQSRRGEGSTFWFTLPLAGRGV
jgi:PAS domain S-box-containing protein